MQRIFTNDPGARLGEVEPVHQMRVGARRLRSDLRTFAPMLDEAWAERLRDELQWLGSALGQARDMDVMQELLHADAKGLEPEIEPLFGYLDEQQLVGRAALLKALRSERYVQLLDALVEAARSPVLTPAAWTAAGEALPPLADRTWSRLAHAARALDQDDPDERFHEVRKLAKRARYAAEAVAPALGEAESHAASRFARGPRRVQDILGGLQDSVVARDLVRELATSRPTDGSFALAAGRLLEREEQAGREARDSFPKAWKKLDKPKQPAGCALATRRVVSKPIRAAGGVVWRAAAEHSNNEAIEVALIHRPRYDDWSIPKGKLASGESELEGPCVRCSRRPATGCDPAGGWERSTT